MNWKRAVGFTLAQLLAFAAAGYAGWHLGLRHQAAPSLVALSCEGVDPMHILLDMKAGRATMVLGDSSRIGSLDVTPTHYRMTFDMTEWFGLETVVVDRHSGHLVQRIFEPGGPEKGFTLEGRKCEPAPAAPVL